MREDFIHNLMLHNKFYGFLENLEHLLYKDHLQKSLDSFLTLEGSCWVSINALMIH
jgi:hypothetical protein